MLINKNCFNIGGNTNMSPYQHMSDYFLLRMLSRKLKLHTWMSPKSLIGRLNCIREMACSAMLAGEEEHRTRTSLISTLKAHAQDLHPLYQRFVLLFLNVFPIVTNSSSGTTCIILELSLLKAPPMTYWSCIMTQCQVRVSATMVMAPQQ